MLTLDKVYHAAYVLKDVVRKTSLISSPKINPECELYLKTENLQITGSFKVRGAGYKISNINIIGGNGRFRRCFCPWLPFASTCSAIRSEMRLIPKMRRGEPCRY